MNEQLLTEEELLIRNTIRDYANSNLSERAARYDETGEFPWDNVNELADLGVLGLTIDEDFGGSGGTMRQLALVSEEIARGCVATSVIYIAHLSLTSQYINTFGDDYQKQKYLPDLATGKKIGAFALTEPGAGSDAASIQTSSLRANGHYVINGTKTYISNAPEAGVFVTLATRGKSQGYKGIDALIVDGDLDGIEVNQLHGKMGVRASTVGEIVFKNCHVPVHNRLGEESVGFRQTMEVLNASRISIAAQCVGIAQAALEESVQYARTRKVFGGPLGDLQAIQWMIADMAAETEAARQLVMSVASKRDAGVPFLTEASMAKLFASRVAMQAAHKAVQIHGGAGYFAPTKVERLFRDARVTEIYEGTSEVQRMLIARNILKQ
ncbi:MAG: acyl-CoA dehydrogenase family protein [Chloroflexota bacterium]|uniref:Acyl-CoA dehydrogenase n=1 Tax=marine metagenome TaxID=408172 RepID=A0A382BL75_9ZZZZ|nr:acyl-CoA dehydrogenase family protein [Chloroflexota bacterium]